jgi:alcohol dehydrogenase (cytochrome c)
MHMKRLTTLRKTTLIVALLAVVSGALAADYAPVTDARLKAAATDDGWLMYRHDYTSSGYSPFDTINVGNVSGLKQVWDYKTAFEQGHESPAIVNGDFLYITTPKDELVAFQASTGKQLWRYQHDLSQVGLKTVCCDVVNRGVALYDNDVYMATLDNYVVALDAVTGKVQWKRQLLAADEGAAMTLAPLIVKGKVIVGLSGGEYGARGFITALDAKTGKPLWKQYTVPAPNEPGGKTWPKGAYKTGGGGAWLTGTYEATRCSGAWATRARGWPRCVRVTTCTPIRSSR